MAYSLHKTMRHALGYIDEDNFEGSTMLVHDVQSSWIYALGQVCIFDTEWLIKKSESWIGELNLIVTDS